MVRDAAVARLTVIGARAAGFLAGLAGDRKAPTGRPARRAARAGSDGRTGRMRARPRPLDDPAEDVVRAAIAALRPHVHGACARRRRQSADSDRAWISTRGVAAREAALRVLLGSSTSVRCGRCSRRSATIRRRDRRAGGEAPPPAQPPPEEPGELLAGAVEGRLPADAEMVRRALAQAGDTLSLTDVLALIERIREHEKTQPLAARRHYGRCRAHRRISCWRAGSQSRCTTSGKRWSARRSRSPLEFLAALNALGDVSCVEAIGESLCVDRRSVVARPPLQTFRTIVRRAAIDAAACRHQAR